MGGMTVRVAGAVAALDEHEQQQHDERQRSYESEQRKRIQNE